MRPPGHPQNVGWRRPRGLDTLAGERPQPGTQTGPGRRPGHLPVPDVLCLLRRPPPEEAGEMDEIGQDPKLNVRFPRGRWLDAAVAVALIAAAAIAVMTSQGSRPAAAPAGRPGAAPTP